MPSGVVSVPAGDITVTITGTFFTPPYPVALTPIGWNAGGPYVISQSATQIVAGWPVAPAADASLSWVATGSGTTPVVTGITSTLEDYLDELRAILHDPADKYWSQALKVTFINRAIRQRDLDTSANRIMQSFTLTQGVDLYSLADLGNPNVFDVVNINLVWNAIRYPLDQRSKVQLDADYRLLVNALGMPVAFARYGPSTSPSSVYFGPVPNMAYVTEWDCAVLSPALAALTDVDAVPYPWTKPVVYYAAYRAKLNERRDQEAQGFLAQYNENVYGSISAPTGLQRQVTSQWGGRF